MWCGTKIKKEVCCICFEKEITLSCYFCLEGNLCSVCVVKLCEEGSAGTCPILANCSHTLPGKSFFHIRTPPCFFHKWATFFGAFSMCVTRSEAITH